jgi:hypothetical protein
MQEHVIDGARPARPTADALKALGWEEIERGVYVRAGDHSAADTEAWDTRPDALLCEFYRSLRREPVEPEQASTNPSP